MFGFFDKTFTEILNLYGHFAIELICAFLIVMFFIKVFAVNYQLKQMTALDLIINFILGAILGGFITNPTLTTLDFVVAMSFFIVLVYVVILISKKTEWGRRLLVGKPKVIIENGKLDDELVDRLNLNAQKIAIALRQQKIYSLSQVKMARIEPGGELTVIKKGTQNYFIIIIDNGTVDWGALEEIGKSKKWLKDQLVRQKIKSPTEVFIAQWHNNRLYVIRKS